MRDSCRLAPWLLSSAIPFKRTLRSVRTSVGRHGRTNLPERNATETVQTYFSRILAGDPNVADVFHDDGQLIGLGRITSGKPAIRAFYEESIRQASPTPELIGELLAAGPRVAAEIKIALANGSVLHVVDLFVVEGGKIRSLTYFVADHASPDT